MGGKRVEEGCPRILGSFPAGDTRWHCFLTFARRRPWHQLHTHHTWVSNSYRSLFLIAARSFINNVGTHTSSDVWGSLFSAHSYFSLLKRHPVGHGCEFLWGKISQLSGLFHLQWKALPTTYQEGGGGGKCVCGGVLDSAEELPSPDSQLRQIAQLALNKGWMHQWRISSATCSHRDS